MAGSWRSRKLLACALVGVGGFLTAGAAFIPLYTVGQLAKTPLDLEITTVAPTEPDHGGEVLDAKTLTSPTGAAKVDTNVPLISQRFVTVEEPSGKKYMTVQAGQTLRRNDKQGDTGLLSATIDRVTIDRKTGEPSAAEPNGSIEVTPPTPGTEAPADEVQHVGLQYRFPFDTKQQNYPYFDLNARATYDMNFVAATEIKDLPVFHFTQTIAPVSLAKVMPKVPTYKLTLPAAKWGVPGGQSPVTMVRWYANQRDVWVEPKTGIIIKGEEKINFYYARAADKPEVTAMKANLIFDENTIENQLAIAKDGIDKLSMARIAPIVIGAIGILTILAGGYLGLTDGRRRGGKHAVSNEDAPTEIFPTIK